MLYAHGGGMIAGDLDAYYSLLSWYVSMTGGPTRALASRFPFRQDRCHSINGWSPDSSSGSQSPS